MSTSLELNPCPNSNLIDSHCHLNSPELRDDAAGHVTRALEAGITKMFVIGADLDDSREAVEIAHKFTTKTTGIFAAIGVHPHEVARYFTGQECGAEPEIMASLNELAQDHRVVAVGEIGLDYYYDHSPRDVQRFAFERQLDWAARINKPVILHIRDAMPDALQILRSFIRHAGHVKLLFHCYSGGLEWLDDVLNLGGYCAVGGAVTWKKSAELREVVRRMPLDRLLLETDCPWMAPVPFRGKLNTPAFVRYVYESVAKVRGLAMKELIEQIADNAASFFSL